MRCGFVWAGPVWRSWVFAGRPESRAGGVSDPLLIPARSQPKLRRPQRLPSGSRANHNPLRKAKNPDWHRPSGA